MPEETVTPHIAPLKKPDFRFPKSAHVRMQKDFDRVYEQKAAYNDGTLLVFVGQNTAGTLRIGLSVSKKVGNAVKRNRWKRLLRESFRLQRAEMEAETLKKIRNAQKKWGITSEALGELGDVLNLDIIVIPRLAVRPTLKAVKKSLRYCVKRAALKLFGLEERREPATPKEPEKQA